MKRYLVATVLSLSLILVACGSSVASTSSTSSNSSASVTSSSVITSKEASTEDTTSSESSTEASIEKRTSTDFRNTCWGDSLDDVKKYETDAEYGGEDDEGDIYYTDTVVGHDVNVVYICNNDKLVKAGYLLNEDLTTGGQYLGVLRSWKDVLVKKYGEPNSKTNDVDGIFYTVDKDQANMVDEGQALEYGYTGYVYTWKVNNSIIRLAATSKDFKISVALMYQDKNYDDSAEDASDF